LACELDCTCACAPPYLLGAAATYWPRASSALQSALLTLAKELLAQFDPAPGQVPEPC